MRSCTSASRSVDFAQLGEALRRVVAGPAMPRDSESPVWPFDFRQGDRVMDTVMQRENEAGRVVLVGRRTDDGAQCSVISIHEFGGAWALYPRMA